MDPKKYFLEQDNTLKKRYDALRVFMSIIYQLKKLLYTSATHSPHFILCPGTFVLFSKNTPMRICSLRKSNWGESLSGNRIWTT